MDVNHWLGKTIKFTYRTDPDEGGIFAVVTSVQRPDDSHEWEIHYNCPADATPYNPLGAGWDIASDVVIISD